MIKSIRLQNFFGFQDCTINLEKGENVLVGINGSGKSNFFKAIKLLRRGIVVGGLNDFFLKQLGGFNRISFIGNTSEEIDLSVNFYNSKIYSLENNISAMEYNLYLSDGILSNTYEISEKINLYYEKDPNIPVTAFFNKHGKIEIDKSIVGAFDSSPKNVKLKDPYDSMISQLASSFEIIGDIYSRLSSLYVYDGFNTSQDSPIRRPVRGTLDARLNSDGVNLPQILNSLNVRSKGSFKKVEDALRNVNENYIGIDFYQVASEIELRLEEKGFDKSVPIQDISDGTLRFLCLMAILYNPERGTVICIDEPELGLHPDMIHTLSEAIKFAAQTSQIIISTHSPQLLDWFDFENVRIFEKDEHNATVVRELDKKKFEGWYDTYMLGDMWMKGDIGGNRW